MPSYFYRSLCGITTNSLSLLGAGMMSWRVLGEFQGIRPFFMSVFAKASCTTKNGHHWENYAASTMASLFERGSSSTLYGGKPHRLYMSGCSPQRTFSLVASEGSTPSTPLVASRIGYVGVGCHTFHSHAEVEQRERHESETPSPSSFLSS